MLLEIIIWDPGHMHVRVGVFQTPPDPLLPIVLLALPLLSLMALTTLLLEYC